MAKDKPSPRPPARARNVPMRFLATWIVQDGTGTCYDAGKVYLLTETGATHFRKRGLAEDAPGAEAEAVEPRTATIVSPHKEVTVDSMPANRAPSELEAGSEEARRRADAQQV